METPEIKTKTCSKCKEEKTLDNYYISKEKKSGKLKMYSCCKECSYKTGFISSKKHRDRQNKTSRETYKKNPEQKRREAKNHAEKYPEKIKERWQKWYAKNRDKQILKAKKQYLNDKENINIRKAIRQKERFKTDKVFNITHSIRTRTYRAFNQKGWKKGGSTESLLGTTYEIAKSHIERQFTKGMGWVNRGEWHIDHKIPLSSAKTEEGLKLLCHYTNLQPLWKLDNLSKNDTIIPTQMTLTI